MPPNARSIANSGTLSGGGAKANASIANNQYKPTFEAGVCTDYETTSLQEVAKEFDWREFGNGSANTGTGGTYPDMSMLGAADTASYIMEDGLTGMKSFGSEQPIAGQRTTLSWGANAKAGITWIGTGLTLRGQNNNTNSETITIAQNLPYGSHVYDRLASNFANIDGISFGQSSASPRYYFKDILGVDREPSVSYFEDLIPS